MRYLVTNWKTTVLGAGALFTALGHLLNALATGDTSTIPTDAMAIMTAVGVIFAKDGNVSGGAK